MSDSGKYLEQFVSQIEKILVPQGFTVELRESAFNNDGLQIAEFDIIIAGKVGSAPFKMLIECRDRPSSGSAPASWIEQLVGRRTRFNFDKVVAVSTTGFSDGAIEFASNSNIELRSVKTLNLNDIVDWFHFRLFACIGKLNHVDFGARSDEVFQALEQSLPKGNTDPQKTMFVRKNDGKAVSLQTVWSGVFDKNRAHFNNLSEGETRSIVITVDRDDSGDKYYLETGNDVIPVDQINFGAEFSLQRITPSFVTQYSETAGDPIALAVRFIVDTGNGAVEIDYIKFKD